MSAFHIWTIGCQMNVADSRRLAESLEKYGLEAAEGPHDADVVVLYSCVIRQQAEDRVHGQLHALQKMKAARPEMKVVVAGCVSDIPDWHQRYPFVDLIAEPGQDLTVRDRLIDLLDLSERYRFDPEQAVRLTAGGTASAESMRPFLRPPHDYGVAVLLLGAADHLVPASQVDPLRSAVRRYLFASALDSNVDKSRAAQEFNELRMLQKQLPEPSASLLQFVNDRDVVHLGSRLLPYLSAYGGDPSLSVSKENVRVV